MKKTGRLLAILLALGMLLSLGACGFSTEPVQQEDYDSPLEYYRAVETRNAQDLMAVGQLLALTKSSQSQSFSQGELLLALDQSVLDPYVLSLLNQAVGMDMSWLRSLGIGFLAGQDGDLAQENLTLRVNGTDIANLETVIDKANLFEYFTVPEISSTSLGLDLADLFTSRTSLTPDELKALFSGEFLTPEDAIELLARYYGVVLSNVEQVELSSGSTVNVGGVEAPCTVATVTIDGEAMLKIAKSVLATARYDQKLEKLIFLGYRLTNNYYGDETRFHADYDNRIQQLINDLDDTDPADIDGTLIMHVAIDDNGNILGRGIEVISEGETVGRFSYMAVSDGTNIGIGAGFSVVSSGTGYYSDPPYSWRDETTMTFEGSASYSPVTGSVTGNFLVSMYNNSDYNGQVDELAMDLFTLDLNASIDENGLQGEVLLTPCDDLMNKLLEELDDAPQPIVDLVKSLTLAFVIHGENGAADCAWILRSNGSDLLSLSLTTSQAEPFAITVPADVADPDAWINSLGVASLNPIIVNLQNAGVPDELINALFG